MPELELNSNQLQASVGRPTAQPPGVSTLKLSAVCLGLVVLVLWGFLPSLRNDFVNYDDDVYVVDNNHVTSGLTLENALWALQSGYAANWHPLTWVSHMLDCQLYGLKPWGHHLNNVLWHAVNTLLVFLVFKRMTGAVWRCGVLAALFALHPIQVDTVAWVAERKNLLSTFFFLLALWAYTRYAQNQSGAEVTPALDLQPSTLKHFSKLDARRSTFDYLTALVSFALGLMCKPAVVILPLVLLSLDYWPLERFRPGRRWRLLREKIPFFALAAAASIVTFTVQKLGGAMPVPEDLPLPARGGNAVISYWRYLGKLVWPTDLAVFYPHPLQWPLLGVWLASLLLLGVSVLAATQWKRRSYLPVGWVWFLGTLVPVIGLVQVGGQAMADRFMYVPLIGLLLALVWGMHDLTGRWRYQPVALTGVGATAIVACLMLTRNQLSHWRDSESLFRHAIATTENNYVAHNNLGLALSNKGLFDQAIGHYREALRIKSGYPDAHNNLGITLSKQGLTHEAISQFEQALRLKPSLPEAHNNLALALAKQGRVNEAIDQFQAALKLNSRFPQAHHNLGNALLKKGQEDEAIAQFRRALQLNPNFANAQSDLGTLLLRKGRTDEAVAHYQAAIATQPANALFLNNLAWVLATSSETSVRNGARAVEMAQQAERISKGSNPAILGTLAAAYAEAGRFPEALVTAQHALELVAAQTNSAQADMLRANIALFRAGSPFHEAAQTNTSRDTNHR